MLNLRKIYATKITPILLGILLLFTLLWLQISSLPLIQEWRERLNNIVYDIQLNSQIPKSTKQDVPVVVVLIDDQSLVEQGHWPWSRQKLANLVTNLHHLGATVIAMDLTFPEVVVNPVEKVIQLLDAQGFTKDAALNKAMQNMSTVFNEDAVFVHSIQNLDITLGVYFHFVQKAQEGILPPPLLQLNPSMANNNTVISFPHYTSNFTQLQQMAKSSGFINVFADWDGEIRRAPLIIQYGQNLYPSLALSAVKLYLLSNTTVTWQQIEGKWNVEKIILGKQIIPVDGKGQVLIPYHLLKDIPTIPATDILHNKMKPNALAGKLVFIGASATGLGDLKTTPSQDVLPGAQIHAAVAAGIFQNDFYTIPGWAKGAEFIITLLTGLLCILIFPYLRSSILTLISLVLIVLLLCFSSLLYAKEKLFLSFIMAIFSVFLLAVLNALYGYFSEEVRRKQMRSLFAQYIPASHLKKLLEQGKEMKSETQVMTVLFCDIRNFTSIAEKMSAVAIAELLNQFFTPMTEIIFKHGGTIDKYIGDMVMAFWGAPLTDLEHAKHAMEAALEMQTAATKLRDEFLAQDLPPINIGIGINTGLMNVGDMGSEFRRTYTVIGDAVNVGSRLENLTKKYHVGIIVSETTKAQQNDFKFIELGEVMVKGKHEAVTIYELIGKMSES